MKRDVGRVYGHACVFVQPMPLQFQSADARARKLASWLTANGVRTSNLRFAPSPDGQVAVYATRRLEADETVGWIPKQCILSPINSRVGELLREHEISHGLALTG